VTMPAMPSTPNPITHPWRTRGEFLAARAAAVPQIERLLLAPGPLFRQAALVFAAAVSIVLAGYCLDASPLDATRMVSAAVFSAAALATVVPTARRALRNRALIAELLAWDVAERRWRDLPAGEARPEHRMPFDAREDPDFEQVAATVGSAAQGRPLDGRLLLRSVPSGLGIVLGLTIVLSGAFDLPAPSGVILLAGGSYVLLCPLVQFSASNRLALRLSRTAAAIESDIRSVRAQRIGSAAAEAVDRAWRLKQALALSPFVLLLVAILIGNVSRASPVARWVTAAVVVLAVVVSGVVLLVRRARDGRSGPDAELELTPPSR
jgi:hypothetical protein